MRYLLSLGAAGPGRSPEELSELAVMAEHAGWDALLLEDYLIYPGDSRVATYDVWIALAAMAAATSRIRLGTDVTPLGRQRPWEIAARAVSLDHLSHGRVILGVGAGDVHEASFRATGEPGDPHVAAGRLDEGIDIIAALWTGGPTSYSGRHYQLDHMQMLPGGVQEPRIPLWIGGDWRVPGVRRRILKGDGCLVYKGTPGTPSYMPLAVDDVAAIAAHIRSQRGTLDGYDICVGGNEPDQTDPDYLMAIAEAGATWWSEWLPVAPLERTRRQVEAGPHRIDADMAQVNDPHTSRTPPARPRDETQSSRAGHPENPRNDSTAP